MKYELKWPEIPSLISPTPKDLELQEFRESAAYHLFNKFSYAVLFFVPSYTSFTPSSTSSQSRTDILMDEVSPSFRNFEFYKNFEFPPRRCGLAAYHPCLAWVARAYSRRAVRTLHLIIIFSR